MFQAFRNCLHVDRLDRQTEGHRRTSLRASRMANPIYAWRVYVAGQKGRSRWAVENLKKIYEQELPGQYKIEVVDVSKNPRTAVEKNLTALPAVFRTLPAPVRKFVGNWANENDKLVGFELVTQDKPKDARRSRSSDSHKKTP